MCAQLERLALQPQRWGLTGEAEECLRLCVFCLIWWFFWYWLCWRQRGSTAVVGFQLEEESLLRAAHLPDHWDDCLFCTTTADNERLDQKPTDCPRTSCIIYGLLLYLCFVFTQTLGLASAAAHTERRKTSAAVWALCLCRGAGTAGLLNYCARLNRGYSAVDRTIVFNTTMAWALVYYAVLVSAQYSFYCTITVTSFL